MYDYRAQVASSVEPCHVPQPPASSRHSAHLRSWSYWALARPVRQLAERPYLTLDDFDLRVQAAADPEAVVDRAPSLIIDEVQRARDLLIAVKRAVRSLIPAFAAAVTWEIPCVNNDMSNLTCSSVTTQPPL